jgi:oligopeptide transport system substrate-binding protein
MQTLIGITRRAVLFTALAVTLALAGPAAAEKTLRIANMGEPESFDPHKVSGVWTHRILRDIFTGLTTEGQAGEAIAGAAESWTVSGDGTVYTFKIRDHVWSDGKPVTAQDFVFSFRRILLPETAAEYASAINTGKAAAETLGARAIDERTLEVTLRAPTPYFLTQLTHYTAWPVPQHVVEKHGADWTKRDNIVGNGPYLLEEWVPSTHVKLVRNPKFYDPGSVKIDRVVYYPGEDRVAGQKRFRAGEVEIATDFSSDQIDWLHKNLPKETRIAPYLGIYYYPINTSKPPFNDKRIRQAMSLAINREAITDKVLKSGEIPAYSFVPPGTPETEFLQRAPRARQQAHERSWLRQGPASEVHLELQHQ